MAGSQGSRSGVPGRHHLLRHKLTLEDPTPSDKTPAQPEGKRTSKTPRDADPGKLTNCTVLSQRVSSDNGG